MAKPAPAQPRSPWTFPFCPQPPDWTLDWPAIQNEFAWLRSMADCRQDPAWHLEGNVLAHTRMVCKALVAMDPWRGLSPEERSVLFAAALLHDVGKPLVTREENGRIRSPRHAAKGALAARTILWENLLPAVSLEHFHLREQIVALVHHHPLPLHFLNLADSRREVITVSQIVRLDWLAMLAEADAVGRQAADRDELLERVELFRELARETQCYAEPRRFASPHTRFLYFHGRELDPDVEAYDDTRLEVIVMCGLPGAGKDRWIAENVPNVPVISLDAIRGGLGIKPEDDQGAVASQAKELARGYLRQGRAFVWNATNTTPAMRRQLIGMLTDYHARVRLVYVETAWDELLRRNRGRSAPVPETVLRRLAERLEVPDVTEAHEVDWSTT
jgi:putative nucleotidyltransferase with HDIG domain